MRKHQWTWLVAFGLVTTLCGCGRRSLPVPDGSDARPPVDLLRLVFRPEGVTVDTLESDRLMVVTDAWVLNGRPVDGRRAQNAFAALNGVVRGNPACRVDVLEAPGARTTVHRFLRGVTGELATQGDYLVQIDGHWIYFTVFPRQPGGSFNTASIDSFLIVLSLADAPGAGAEVPQPWKQYQKARKPGTPDGKFILSMAPSPVYLGSHPDYLEAGRSSRGKALRFTPGEFARGGKRLIPGVLQLFTKEERASVRVDIWLGGEPADGRDRQEVYRDELQVTSHAVDLWSSDEPCSLAVEPGLYDVRFVLVNRGRVKDDRFFTDGERFGQDDCERYEIIMNLKPAR